MNIEMKVFFSLRMGSGKRPESEETIKQRETVNET
jgi:hypothetical protein